MKHLGLVLTLSCLFFTLDTLQAAPIATPVRGRLRERGTLIPLAQVSVYLLPSGERAITNSSGEFDFPENSTGDEFIVQLTGYQKMQAPVDANADKQELYLERENYQRYKTTIVDQAEKRDDTSKVLKRQDFLQAPGSGGDPVKAVQNLAGINRARSFSSQVLIQGSGPQDTKYAMDGHEIPLVFHFGGLTSVAIPEAVDRVETLYAGYGPDNGRAIGGWVGLWTRSPEKDRIHGMGFVDLFNAGALLEGPTGEDSAFLISARQSYFGAVLKSAFKNEKDFNLTVAPQYRDFTALYETRLTPRDQIKTSFIASHDSLEFLLTQPVKTDPSLRGEFSSTTAFFRLVPQWEHRHGESTISRTSLGLGKDWISFHNDQNYFNLASYTATLRAEIDQQLTPDWKSTLGIDQRFRWTRVELSIPSFYTQGGVANPLSTGTRQRADIKNQNMALGFFSRNEWNPLQSDWTLLPNFRVDYFSTPNEWIMQPRPGLRYRWDDSLTLRTSGGLYAQPPQEQEANVEFGNPNLKSPRAWHVTVGMEKDFRENSQIGWTMSNDIFGKFISRNVVPSITERYANDGQGRVLGFQTLTKYAGYDWSTQIAYTLSQSRAWTSSSASAPSAYDQTHLIGVIGSLELGNNWKLSGRIRYSTGNPNTPIIGSYFDSDNDAFIPERGAYYSERISPFSQVDARIDKKWIYDTWILSLYLDIQNLTNRRNVESYQYTYDYSSRTTVSGLPVLPTLGLKGEF